MEDKIQKIREEVEKLKSQLIRGACSSQIAMETRCKEEAYNEVLAILDTLQEEPAPKVLDDMPLDPNIQYASREIGIKAHAEDYSFNIESELFQQLNKEQQELWRKEIEQACMSGGYCGLNLGLDKRYDKEEPVSEDLEEASLEYFKQALKDGNKTKLDAFKAGANWQEKRLLPMIDKICGMCQKQQDFIDSKDLGELISTLSRRYPEVSFAKLSRIAVRVAKWQKLKDMGITNNAKGVVTNILNSSDKSLDTYATEVAFIMIPANLTENYHMTNRDRISDAVRLGAQWQKEKEYTCYEEAFEDGAKWKKEQMMTKSIEAVVSQVPCSNEIILYNPSSVYKYCLPQEMNKLGLNKGDKVKVVIIKED